MRSKRENVVWCLVLRVALSPPLVREVITFFSHESNRRSLLSSWCCSPPDTDTTYVPLVPPACRRVAMCARAWCRACAPLALSWTWEKACWGCCMSARCRTNASST